MNERVDAVWRSARHAKNFLDGTREVIPLAAEQLAVMLTVVKKAKPDLKSVLDLGCGDGALGRYILSAFPEANGLFADFAPTMLDAAREALIGDKERSQVVELDFGESGWAEAVKEHGPYDAIVSGFAIHHQPDEIKKSIYRDCHDLLTTGGIFLNMEHALPPTEWVEELFRDSFLLGLYEYNEKKGDKRSRQEMRDEWMERQHANIGATVEDQCEWLRNIGFTDVDCFFKIYELALFGGRRFI